MMQSCPIISPEELFEKLKSIQVGNPLCEYTLDRCRHLAPLINEIEELKAETDAMILAHSYVHPDIIYGVADHVGDSFGLSKCAMQSESEVIVFPSVRFMAETAKILNPQKTVIDPNPNGGCSLADSITADDVYELRETYPSHTFICYINTTAEVKAACDVCVTSSNVYTIIENVPSDRIVFLPDKWMGMNIISHLKEKGVEKEIILYDGECYVHEEFTTNEVDQIRETHPDCTILAHPECRPEVASKADVIGSTSSMINYVKEHKDEDHPFLLLTECGIASRLQVENPELRLLGSCMLCKYMRSNSLQEIKQALEDPSDDQIIEINPLILTSAQKCLENMFHYAK